MEDPYNTPEPRYIPKTPRHDALPLRLSLSCGVLQLVCALGVIIVQIICSEKKVELHNVSPGAWVGVTFLLLGSLTIGAGYNKHLIKLCQVVAILSVMCACGVITLGCLGIREIGLREQKSLGPHPMAESSRVALHVFFIIFGAVDLVATFIILIVSCRQQPCKCNCENCSW